MVKKELIIILVATFIVVMAWIVFDIIHSIKSKRTVSPDLQTALEPIDPNFDTVTLDTISKLSLTPLIIQPIIVPTQAPTPAPTLAPTPKPSPTPSPLPTPVSSSSPLPSPTPSASSPVSSLAPSPTPLTP